MSQMQPDDRAAGLEPLLRAQRVEAFEPGFAWRVMHRLRAERMDPRAALAAVVSRYFLRLAPVAGLATVALALLNVRAASQGQTALEAVLGLPPVTVEQAYQPFEAASTPAKEGDG